MSKKVCDKCQSLYPDFGYCMPCFLETTDDNASLQSQLAKLEEQLRVAKECLDNIGTCGKCYKCEKLAREALAVIWGKK
jgi:hypothetical protein